MALRLPAHPSTLSGGKSPTFSCPKPSQIQIPVSLSFFSPLKHTPSNSRTLLFPISLATQQEQSPLTSTVPSTLENPSPDSHQQLQEQESIPDRRRLIAQNIPWTSSAEDVRSLFERHGTVVDIELAMYNKIKNKGLAFVTMGSEEEALAALANLDSYELDGRVIKVEFSRSAKKKPSVTTNPVKMYDVFVGNLSWKVTSGDLREFFATENESVLRAEVVYHTNPRRPAGYGFVSFSSKEEVKAAIANYNGKELMGKSIHMELSKKDIRRYERESNGNQFEGESVKPKLDAVPPKQTDEMSNDAE